MEYLLGIALVLFLGTVCTILAKKLEMSNILPLILASIILSSLEVNGSKILAIPDFLLRGIAFLALILLVFDLFSRLRVKTFDVFHSSAIKIFVIGLVMNLIFLSLSAYALFRVSALFLLFIYSSWMTGVSPDSLLPLIDGKKVKSAKTVEILRSESIIGSPITLLISFLILNFVSIGVTPAYSGNFFILLLTGAASGLLVGMIMFRLLVKNYSKKYSPLAMISGVVIAYLLAEYIGGSGIFSIATLGFFYGNVHIHAREELAEFSDMFAELMQILVFILIGFAISIPHSLSFIFKSLLLFFIYLLLRYLSVTFALMHHRHPLKERLFITLNCAKGIAGAAVLFVVSGFFIGGIPSGEFKTVLSISLLFLIYSVITTQITQTFAYKFRV